MNFTMSRKNKIIISLAALFIFLTFVQGFAKQVINIEEIDLADDVFLLILFVLAVIFASLNKLSVSREYLFIFAFPFIFLVYLLITGVINNVPLIIALVSFRDYFQYILFFLFLVVFFNKYMFERVHNFILLLGILQILFAVGQIISTKISNTFYPDLIGGTIGRSGAHILSSVLIFFVGYYLSKIIFESKIDFKGILYLLAVVVLLIVISFRTLLILSPVIIFLHLIIIRMYRKKMFLIVAASVILLVIIAGLVINYTGIYAINIKGLIEEQMSSELGGRILQFKYILNDLLDTPLKLIFGDGPGTFFSKTCRFFDYERWSWVKDNIVRGYIQYVISLAEIGFAGILGIVAFYILIIRRLRNELAGNIPSSSKVIMSATIFYIISYLFSGAGGNIFEWQETNTILWFYIAYCCSLAGGTVNVSAGTDNKSL
jgi:O-antigen ligase